MCNLFIFFKYIYICLLQIVKHVNNFLACFSSMYPEDEDVGKCNTVALMDDGYTLTLPSG